MSSILYGSSHLDPRVPFRYFYHDHHTTPPVLAFPSALCTPLSSYHPCITFGLDFSCQLQYDALDTHLLCNSIRFRQLFNSFSIFLPHILSFLLYFSPSSTTFRLYNSSILQSSSSLRQSSFSFTLSSSFLSPPPPFILCSSSFPPRFTPQLRMPLISYHELQKQFHNLYHALISLLKKKNTRFFKHLPYK